MVAAVDSPPTSLPGSQLEGPSGGQLEPALESTETAANDGACLSEEDDFHPGLRLWIIILGLGVTLLLTALENTVVTVAMPYIISDLGLGDDYIWITNAFFICRYVLAAVLARLGPFLNRSSSLRLAHSPQGNLLGAHQ